MFYDSGVFLQSDFLGITSEREKGCGQFSEKISEIETEEFIHA
jgi:hypothetical protein